eukprot:scaffold8259_cov143-Cylindrotheca_fusiformis.AAC.21
MSASAGQTVAILSLDSEYRQWHRDTVVSEATDLNRVWKRRGMQKASAIVLRPVGDILLGVAMGASGLIISPYKGFRKGGTLGLVRGVATGTAGVVAKPLVGVLDAFTHFSATIHDVARSANVLERRYQPALKLRLQYSFGPMKILSPYDAVTARSMDLLKSFPPKGKRGKTQLGRSAEFHIHSEVLHMEHGVETYAIVSTIRVVLIKLKRDNNGLSSSLGWEVSLAGDATVKSLLSDHGHNGVALTITKRAEAKNVPLNQKSKQGRRGSQKGTLQKTNSSSAYSVESGVSIADSEPPHNSQEVDSEQGDFPRQEDSTYKYGSTRKGGEVLEWFTVLAEFQHRVQLTTLHNAICCVVDDFDAIVFDRTSKSGKACKGATHFGLYTFEERRQDSKTSASSNADLIAALEYLPWMHDFTFRRVRNLPEKGQVAEVSRLRQRWTFSKELEASRQQGGPKWLVEARARAMFVPTEPPLAPSLDPFDPLVKKVYLELEQGNISSEQAARLFESHSEVSSPEPDDGQHERGLMVLGGDVAATPRTVEFGRSDVQSRHCFGTEELAERRNSDDTFYSAQLEDSTPMAEIPQIGEGTIVKPAVSFHSDTPFEPTLDEGGSVARASSANRSGDNLYDTAMFTKMSKLERMESLMEQLIQLNAHQAASRNSFPSDAISEGQSTNHESRLADSVVRELSELRAQVQVRAKEDENLRKEIADLRQQLATKNEKKDPSKKLRKLPDILGFGKNRKSERPDSPSDAGPKDVEPKEAKKVLGTDPAPTEDRPVPVLSPPRRSNSQNPSVDSILASDEEIDSHTRMSSRDFAVQNNMAQRSLSSAGSFDCSAEVSVNDGLQQVRNRRGVGASSERSLDSVKYEDVAMNRPEGNSTKKGALAKILGIGQKRSAIETAASKHVNLNT